MKRLLHISRHVWAHIACRFWTIFARARFAVLGVSVGRGLRVSGPLLLHVHPTARVVIGDNCTLHSGFAANPVGGASRLAIWVGPSATLTIGTDVGISNATIVAKVAIAIGSHSRIGGGACVFDTDFHSLDLPGRLAQPDTGVRCSPVVFAEGAFVGANAIILKGSSLGEGAILGAGAVLSRKVPAAEIWAGNPACQVGSVMSHPKK